MRASIYTRPNKPLTIEVRQRKRGSELLPRIAAGLQSISDHAPIAVDGATECHVTPDEQTVALCEYSSFDRCDVIDLLEPSAGTGKIITAAQNYFSNAYFMAIERHYGLFERLSAQFNDQSIRLVNGCFLEASNSLLASFDLILMNPPFRHVKKHIEAAISCLKYGGELVAIVPITFDHPSAETMEILGAVFSNTDVKTKIIKICR